MIYDPTADDLKRKVWQGERIDAEEAMRLYRLPLSELGSLADRRRQIAKADQYNGKGDEIVTYILDRNINYTNICNVYCKFCAFYRTEKDLDSYVISHEELDGKIDEMLEVGGSQILLQGGHHPKLNMDWYLDLLTHLEEKYPQVNVHGFSPSEFVHFREVFGLPLQEIIGKFQEAGLGSIPGGGGEILVDKVRKRISPLKAMSDEWLEVMDTAHRLGLNSSATMMFGHVESVEDRIEHLDRIRVQQDRSGGFTAFICWTFQSENTRLKAPPCGANEYLRMLALSRIYLDNIDNAQSSWVTQGLEIGQIALTYGANDLGSIMMEENVVSHAGTVYHMKENDMHRLIHDLGCEPRRRNNWYQLLN